MEVSSWLVFHVDNFTVGEEDTWRLGLIDDLLSHQEHREGKTAVYSLVKMESLSVYSCGLPSANHQDVLKTVGNLLILNSLNN